MMQNKTTPQNPQNPDHDEFGPIDSLRPIGETIGKILEKLGGKNENQ